MFNYSSSSSDFKWYRFPLWPLSLFFCKNAGPRYLRMVLVINVEILHRYDFCKLSRDGEHDTPKVILPERSQKALSESLIIKLLIYYILVSYFVDGIPLNFINCLSPFTFPLLTYKCNHMLTASTFSVSWKHALIILFQIFGQSATIDFECFWDYHKIPNVYSFGCFETHLWSSIRFP